MQLIMLPHSPIHTHFDHFLAFPYMIIYPGCAVQTATKRLHTNKGGGSAHGGAGGGDAYTAALAEQRRQDRGQRDCRVTGPIRSAPPRLPPAPAEVLVDGMCVPDTALTTTADVAYVLNQEPGKLRIKDVKVCS